MTRSQFEALRTRYDFRCGYCKTGESEAGSLLTVDHFCPRSRGGKDEESNWVYCCFACNSFKAAFWAEGEAALLHPQRDEQASHWSEQDGVVVALTRRGGHHIRVLHLNRSPLVTQRREKAHIQELEAQLQRATQRYNDAEKRARHAEDALRDW